MFTVSTLTQVYARVYMVSVFSVLTSVCDFVLLLIQKMRNDLMCIEADLDSLHIKEIAL